MSEIEANLASEVESEVRRYVASYCGALWNYLTRGEPIDYDALGFWKFPLLMFSGSGDACSAFIRDQSDYDTMARLGYEHYYRNGWDGRVEIHSAKASMISPTLSIVETTGSRYRADDSINSGWSCLYILQRSEGDWKHVAIDAALPPRSAEAWGRWLLSLTSLGDR